MDKTISDRINRKIFPFAQNAAYANPMEMAKQEFSRCKELLLKRVPLDGGTVLLQQMTFQTLNDLMLLEEDYEQELEQLAVETIRDLYDIPEKIVLNANIEDVLAANLEVDLSQDNIIIDPERIPYLDEQIKKRTILNGLSHGSSIHIWKSIHHMIRSPLGGLNERLLGEYDRYTALIGASFWVTPLTIMEQQLQLERDSGDGTMCQQGTAQIEFNDDGAAVQANGIVFPVLLHELNKGVVDFLLMRGLPQDVSADELSYIYQEADKYEHEVWHYLLSPVLWQRLLDGCQTNSKNIPEILSKLCLLDYQELTEVFTSQDIHETLINLNILRKQF